MQPSEPRPGELRPGRDFLDLARRIRDREAARLAGRFPGHELVLVGGSSVPDALTKGDVDLHLRLPAAGFDAAVRELRAVYAVVRPEIWQPTLATFTVEAELPAGLAATPVGSVHDVRFRRSWQLLAADPELLDAYNRVKLRHRDDPDAYEREKSALFDMLLRRWPGHPAGGAAAS